MAVFGEDNNHEDLICDEFDIGVTSINPYNSNTPWKFCFAHQMYPPWDRGEFWPSYRQQSYSSLCGNQPGPFAPLVSSPRINW